MAKSLGSYAALLRSVNVGGKNLLPMKALASMFEDAGSTDVRTYIQSGNVVFRCEEKIAASMGDRIAERIAKDFKINVPVVVRSQKEIKSIVVSNPYLKAGVDPNFLHVLFLKDKPAKAAIATLNPGRSPGDEFQLRGRDVFLHLPNGVARTKLSNAYFDTTLATVSTGRNWRTVLKLLEMVSAA